MRKAPGEKSSFKKRTYLDLYLRFPSGTVFSFCLCKPGFSENGTSTPNGLFQTNNELKTAPLTITWYIVPFKNRKISYFSFFRYVKISRSTIS